MVDYLVCGDAISILDFFGLFKKHCVSVRKNKKGIVPIFILLFHWIFHWILDI
jgi:hypothetical protein